MAKKTKIKKPIMSPDEERFMAFEGLLQWTQAVITQSERVAAALSQQRVDLHSRDPVTRHKAILNLHTQCHFFAIASYKLIEHEEWVLTFGLCTAINFSEIDQFSKQDVKDLRNMREHVVDYFKGEGVASDRWVVETPEYKADASTYNGTMIGGRLDWGEFAAAAERLLPKLLAEPIPYPSR
ncbi:MAG: hypothetical protein WB764_07330 [Xanthobacteraceae bacterium]